MVGLSEKRFEVLLTVFAVTPFPFAYLGIPDAPANGSVLFRACCLWFAFFSGCARCSKKHRLLALDLAMLGSEAAGGVITRFWLGSVWAWAAVLLLETIFVIAVVHVWLGWLRFWHVLIVLAMWLVPPCRTLENATQVSARRLSENDDDWAIRIIVLVICLIVGVLAIGYLDRPLHYIRCSHRRSKQASTDVHERQVDVLQFRPGEAHDFSDVMFLNVDPPLSASSDLQDQCNESDHDRSSGLLLPVEGTIQVSDEETTIFHSQADSLAISVNTDNFDVDAAVQETTDLRKANRIEVAVQTEVSARRPPKLPCDMGSKQCNAANFDHALDGVWEAVWRTSSLHRWLHTLRIHGHDVRDGEGGSTKLQINSDGEVVLEGGTLTLEGDTLVRTGKSGKKVFFERVTYATDEDSDEENTVVRAGKSGKKDVFERVTYATDEDSAEEMMQSRTVSMILPELPGQIIEEGSTLSVQSSSSLNDASHIVSTKVDKVDSAHLADLACRYVSEGSLLSVLSWTFQSQSGSVPHISCNVAVQTEPPVQRTRQLLVDTRTRKQTKVRKTLPKSEHAFDGDWEVVSPRPSLHRWLHTLRIHGHDVRDGEGGSTLLKVNSKGDIVLEGGTLTLEGDTLVRTGKSGKMNFYARVVYTTDEDSDDEADGKSFDEFGKLHKEVA